MEQDWNPRYVRYAKAHGMTPEQMMEHDSHDGDPYMGDFILWNTDCLNKFRIERGYITRNSLDNHLSDKQMEEFDIWQEELVNKSTHSLD